MQPRLLLILRSLPPYSTFFVEYELMTHRALKVSVLGPGAHKWKEGVAEEPHDYELASIGMKPGKLRSNIVEEATIQIDMIV